MDTLCKSRRASHSRRSGGGSPLGGQRFHGPTRPPRVRARENPHGAWGDQQCIWQSGKIWTVTAGCFPVVFRLMHQTFLDVEVEERARPGASSDRAPHAGDPYAVLHLLPSAPPELVTAAHRCLAELNHPDRGGSTATMQAINAAVDAIREAS